MTETAPPADYGPANLVDGADVARYDALGDGWWDPKGAMAPLHRLNPTRIRYLRDTMVRHFAVPTDAALPLDGLVHPRHRLRRGPAVGAAGAPSAAGSPASTPRPTTVRAAARHAEAGGVRVAYRATTAETLAAAGRPSSTPCWRWKSSSTCPTPTPSWPRPARWCGRAGLFVLSTLNRTAKSFALAIVGAEYVLRWLPRGTHDWRQFRTPEEIATPVRRAGLKIVDRTGMVFDPLRDRWSLSRDTDVNYLLAARRPEAG